jgi:hypothetical protein
MGAAAQGRLHMNQQSCRCPACAATLEVGPGRGGLVCGRLAVDQALDGAAEPTVPHCDRHRSRNPVSPLRVPGSGGKPGDGRRVSWV